MSDPDTPEKTDLGQFYLFAAYFASSASDQDPSPAGSRESIPHLRSPAAEFFFTEPPELPALPIQQDTHPSANAESSGEST